MITASDAARAAIAKVKQGFTKVDPAVGADGKSVACWRPEAVAFTLLGAIAACTELPLQPRYNLIARLRALTRKEAPNLEYWTERSETTQQGVIALLCRAIEDGDVPK